MAKNKKNTESTLPDETIIIKIHFVRDQKVMLDFDLAELYQVETNYLKRQVRRNMDRFPEDFMFELTSKEYKSLRSQIGILKRGQHTKYMPFAFTEQGVAMLSGVINSEKGIIMNIAIMRAFVEITKFFIGNKNIIEQIKILFDRISEHDVQLNSIYAAIENLLDDKVDKELKLEIWKKRKRIGFKTNE
ncbi:MAG: ORF6N domain-containing protein [Ginsengibacter sp.]